MNRNIQKWLYGLGAAFISGGAAAAGLLIIHPEDIHSIVKMLEAFVTVGTFSAFLYLKQSPLPAMSETTIITRTEVTKTTVTPETPKP